MLFKIAMRNILRNGRRSVMTAAAIAVSVIALLLFGQYTQFIAKGVEGSFVMRGGHLSVFHKDYFEFGAGNPSGYSIARYRDVMAVIENDPVLKPMLRVVTPTVTMYGIAGNPAVDTSKTFFGAGVVPSDREKMYQWDEYGIQKTGPLAERSIHFPLKDNDAMHGVVGIGLARTLGLCPKLKLTNCDNPSWRQWSKTPQQIHDRPGEPQLSLLAGTTSGAPNIVNLSIREARPQGFKQIDDMYVGMDIALAQQLLYGSGEHKAVSIVVQLYHTADIPKVRARLNALFAEKHFDLEVRDFTEIEPQYNQITGLFRAIFAFISVILGVIVLFTVVNTMTMSVMERTNEIGTARAMGVRRSGIRRQFLAEGLLLGMIGATAGLLASILIASWFNGAGFSWQPPGSATTAPLLLRTRGIWGIQLVIWLALVAMATVSALIPANRAARMNVVDALRHV